MQSIFRYLSLGLNILLSVFIIFEERIVVPNTLDFIGKLHPMILHLPIGIIVVLIVFQLFFKGQFNFESKRNLMGLLALSCSISAVLGFILAKNNDASTHLTYHKNGGVLISLLSYLAWLLYEKWAKKNSHSNLVLGALLATMIWVGHFGSTLTHGPVFSENKKTESTVYAIAILPIFESKCMACHNDNKTKGGLNMANVVSLLKGGKNGPIWMAGHPVQSNIYKRLLLPLEHKEHMPPIDKKQLDNAEILSIEKWIVEGASTSQKLEELKPSSYFFNHKNKKEKTTSIYTFSAASPKDISALNSPVLTLSPIAINSPALKASFFLKSNFQMKDLKSLSKVKEQIVQLDLSKMPVKDEVFGLISNFKNLEILNLNQTEISGKGIDQLENLKNLKQISLANTKVTKENLLPYLNKAKPLKIYLWATKTKPSDFSGLRHRFDFGFAPTSSEIQTLNAPALVNEHIWFNKSENLAFKHSLKGTIIKYALDDNPIDTLNSSDYLKPIFINKNTRIKVQAIKKGWKASEVKEYQFFKSLHLPEKIESLSEYDRAYGTDPLEALCDRNLGDLKNLRDPRWVAFRKNHMSRVFTFDAHKYIEGLTLSYASSTGEHVFPPQQVEVYIKLFNEPFKLYKTVIPKAVLKEENTRGNIDIFINKQNVTAIKLIATPLRQLPSFIKHKSEEKPWLFVDEIFFY